MTEKRMGAKVDLGKMGVRKWSKNPHRAVALRK